MKTFRITPLFIVVFVLLGCKEKFPMELLYIDLDKPSTTPQLFAEDFIGTESNSEFGSVFNETGSELFFAIDKDGKAWIKYTTIKDGKWIEPITIISHDEYS